MAFSPHSIDGIVIQRSLQSLGNSHSSIYDSGFSAVTAGRYLRGLNWYDNEWGYSCRVCDLLGRIDSW